MVLNINTQGILMKGSSKMEKEELIGLFIEFIEDKFPELIEEDKTSFSDGEKYYWLDSDGNVYPSFWENDSVDEGRLLIGNIFKTEEEAEFEIERRKILHELSELARPFDYKSENWCFYLNSEGLIDCYEGFENQYFYGDCYFDSMKEVILAIEKIGASRIKKYLFKED